MVDLVWNNNVHTKEVKKDNEYEIDLIKNVSTLFPYKFVYHWTTKLVLAPPCPPCVLVKYNDANEQNEERKKRK